MDSFTKYLETFVTRDREAEREREQNYIELIQHIKSELISLKEQCEETGLEEVDA